MRETKDLEFKIFADVITFSEFPEELDIKYFTLKNGFKFLKETIKRYGKIDLRECVKYTTNSKATLEFIGKCYEFMDLEIGAKKIDNHYILLKDVYTKNELYKLNENLKKDEITKEEYKKQIDELKFEDEKLPTIIKMSEVNERKQVEREYTEINGVDILTKGIEYGTLNLWSGITNAGKSTLAMQFAKECLNKGKKIFFFAGEHSSYQFKTLLYNSMCSKEELDFERDLHNPNIYDTRPKQEKAKQLDNKYSKLINLYNNNLKEHTVDSIIYAMDHCFKNGTRIFFIDNFMQIENTEKIENQTSIAEKFKQYAIRNNVIINLIVHPRKTQGMTSRLTTMDIAGSQNISNKAINIITIMRTDTMEDDEYNRLGKKLQKYKYDITKCNAIIEIIKTKASGNGMVGLEFDKETRIYKESKQYEFSIKGEL